VTRGWPADNSTSGWTRQPSTNLKHTRSYAESRRRPSRATSSSSSSKKAETSRAWKPPWVPGQSMIKLRGSRGKSHLSARNRYGRNRCVKHVRRNRKTSRHHQPTTPTAAVRPPERLLTSSKNIFDHGGAKGTRTPDPLLANNTLAVHRGSSVQVTVLERSPRSPFVRTGCGTSVRYCRSLPAGTLPWARTGRQGCHRSTRIVHRGPVALASRRSAVSSSQPSVSASAT
jgi:hypothetical protein